MRSMQHSALKLGLSCFVIGSCLTSIAIAQQPPPPPPPQSEELPKIIRKSGGVLQGSATRRIEPAYPPLAKAARVSGAVVVEVTVDEEGNVMSVRAISGHPLLKDAAVDAARGWTFSRTLLQGVPVKVIGTITFNFGHDYSSDIAVLKEKIAAGSTSAELLCQLGVLYLENSEPRKAVEPLKQAILIDPQFAKAYVALGDAYSRTDRTRLAINAYEEAARIKPDYAEAHFHLGMLYWREDRHNEAVESFREAVRINPQMHMGYVGMGRSLAALGRYHEAVESFKQAATIMPDSLEAHLELGDAYLKLGDKEAAMNEYRILKEIRPFMAEQLLERIKKEK